MRRIWVSLVVMTVMALGATTALAAGPAVSKLNGKLDVVGGNVDGESAKIVAGSLSAPLGEKFGLQLDTAYGELSSDVEGKGVGLHLFTRDPEQYLLGVVGTYSVIEDVDFERYAIEAEYYAGSFSLAGKLGQQSGDIDTSAFGKVNLRWYPTVNLMLEVGGSFADSDDKYGHLGLEFQVWKGLSLYAELAAGEENYEHAMVGARYYFGDDKELIKRHREDDPSNEVLEGFTEVLNEVGEAMGQCPAGYVYSPELCPESGKICGYSDEGESVPRNCIPDWWFEER